MAAPRALIRADGTMSGGLGHLVRALSVAEAARSRGWQVTLAGQIDSPAGLALVDAAGLDLAPVPSDNEPPPVEEAPLLEEGPLVEERQGRVSKPRDFAGFDVVHVDSYAVGLTWKPAVNRAGARYSRLEDGIFGRAPADLVFDTFIGSDTPGSVSMTRPADGSAVFRGVAYAPLRPEVLTARGARSAAAASGSRWLRSGGAASRNRESLSSILIAMGGTDATGASATMAGLCSQAGGVEHLRVVAPAARHSDIRAAVAAAPAVPAVIEVVEPGPDFLSWVVEADLVICTASTTVLEVACIGTPALVVAVVDNQAQTYRDVVGQGFARGLGSMEEVLGHRLEALATLERAIADLIAGNGWAEHGRQAVDGRGAERIVAEWERAL